jgi:hypothetical protein
MQNILIIFILHCIHQASSRVTHFFVRTFCWMIKKYKLQEKGVILFLVIQKVLQLSICNLLSEQVFAVVPTKLWKLF